MGSCVAPRPEQASEPVMGAGRAALHAAGRQLWVVHKLASGKKLRHVWRVAWSAPAAAYFRRCPAALHPRTACFPDSAMKAPAARRPPRRRLRVDAACRESPPEQRLARPPPSPENTPTRRAAVTDRTKKAGSPLFFSSTSIGWPGAPRWKCCRLAEARSKVSNWSQGGQKGTAPPRHGRRMPAQGVRRMAVGRMPCLALPCLADQRFIMYGVTALIFRFVFGSSGPPFSAQSAGLRGRASPRSETTLPTGHATTYPFSPS